VDYLNPFQNVTVSQQIPGDRISKDVCRMGEVTGLALRRALICPIEINLMPPHLVARKVFRKRQPFFALSALCLILTMLCWWAYFYRMRASLGVQKQNTEERTTELRSSWSQLNGVTEAKAGEARRSNVLLSVIEMRTRWIQILDALHTNLLDGMWLTSLSPQVEDGRLKYVTISGSGFADKVKDGTHIAKFRDQLIATPYFGEETEITRVSTVRASDYAIEFTLRLALKQDAPVLP
jgi:hypothetical protein